MRLLGGIVAGSLAGSYSARRQFEAMQADQVQQAQINQAQTQAAQAYQVAHAAQAAQAPQASSSVKKDILQDLERLGSLKQQGLITEEEFQKLKIKLISSI